MGLHSVMSTRHHWYVASYFCNASTRTICSVIPHTLLDPADGVECCVIVKDPASDFKTLLAASPVPGFTKVIGVSKLRKDYAQFKDRRALLSEYDAFFADDRIVRMLPQLLGTEFYRKKKHPAPVRLDRGGWAKALATARDSTYMNVGWGQTASIRVGRVGMSADAIVANVMAVVGAAVNAVPGKWKNVASLGLGSTGSVELPIYKSLRAGRDVVAFDDADDSEDDDAEEDGGDNDDSDGDDVKAKGGATRRGRKQQAAASTDDEDDIEAALKAIADDESETEEKKKTVVAAAPKAAAAGRGASKAPATAAAVAVPAVHQDKKTAVVSAPAAATAAVPVASHAKKAAATTAPARAEVAAATSHSKKATTAISPAVAVVAAPTEHTKKATSTAAAAVKPSTRPAASAGKRPLLATAVAPGPSKRGKASH